LALAYFKYSVISECINSQQYSFRGFIITTFIK